MSWVESYSKCIRGLVRLAIYYLQKGKTDSGRAVYLSDSNRWWIISGGGVERVGGVAYTQGIQHRSCFSWRLCHAKHPDEHNNMQI